MSELDAFVGSWNIQATFEDASPGRATFEWMRGEQLLVERWEFSPQDWTDDVEFSGIAIVEFDSVSQNYLQHYFDSRGVVRLYHMSYRDGVWKLWRDKADFSPLDFAQRFIGKFSNDGASIGGSWEIRHDESQWEHDFDVTFSRVT